uniref:Guanylate cyclase domain-containing protein n=1 Tax=Acrobeloides nanus TaxID=290746 RepID=A0A914D6J7_9BILA
MSIIEKKKIDNANDFAEEFKDVTCMIAILTCFDLIYQNCSVKDVTEILDKVYQSFDRLIELHQCQKVARSIDAYHVVSGMPVKINDHAARILNLAIGFVYESQQVIVPKLNLPVVIRIAIHTGTVSAGLVGEAKFRYCVFGEGFDVPKRLLEMDGVQDQIIVTNATKQSVSKSSWDSFDFTNLGYKQVRKNHATCTYRLNKNEKKTIWDIIQQPKESKLRRQFHGALPTPLLILLSFLEEGKSQDGYDKLNQNHIKSWSKIDRQQQLQKISISLMKKNSLPSNFLYHTRGRKFNKTWKRATTISQDSGFSIESNRSLDSVDSIACLIM